MFVACAPCTHTFLFIIVYERFLYLFSSSREVAVRLGQREYPSLLETRGCVGRKSPSFSFRTKEVAVSANALK